MIILGADIGITGALCAVRGNRVLQVIDIPATIKPGKRNRVRRQIDARLLASELRGLVVCMRDEFLVVAERIAAMPSMDATTVFSLGDSAGVVRGVVAALGLPIEYVEPRVWKRRFSLDGNKAASRAKATNFFPDAAHYWKLAKHHNRAESVLLAAYGWERFA